MIPEIFVSIKKENEMNDWNAPTPGENLRNSTIELI
jgi:hypothetical protein